MASNVRSGLELASAAITMHQTKCKQFKEDETTLVS